MIRIHRILTALAGVLVIAATAGMTGHGQPQTGVVVYEERNFTGQHWPVKKDWPGGPNWDRRIRSIRVPSGYRVTFYREQHFQGTPSRITGDWSPPSGNPWIGQIRSLKIERIASQPPLRYPVIYSQRGFQGPARAVERDQPDLRDWDGDPHSIRSIRVPQGWRLLLYEHPNYRGRKLTLTSNWSPSTNSLWSGLTRSIRVYRDNPPVQPR